MLNPKTFATALADAKAAGKRVEIVDGGGLYLDVTPSGSTVWRYRYRVHGQREKVTIGSYPEIGLADARRHHKILMGKVELAAKVDTVASPAKDRQQKIEAERTARLAGTIADLADKYRTHLLEQGKRAKTVDWHIDAYIKPQLGKVRSLDLTTAQVRGMCNKIKDVEKAPASAREVLGTTKRLLQYGVDHGLIGTNPAIGIKPSVYAVKAARERSLSPDELRTLTKGLRDGVVSPAVAAALSFILLTMTRKNEAIKSAWSEFDREARTWLIPGERTKNGKPHLVPLSDQAEAILTSLDPLTEDTTNRYSEWVFQGLRGKPLSDTTLNEALTRANWFGIERFTVHDLRRTASTILHEQGWNTDVIEKALNHTMRGVRGVYNKAEYIDQRRDMLQAWANYLDALREGAKVTPIRSKKTAA